MTGGRADAGSPGGLLAVELWHLAGRRASVSAHGPQARGEARALALACGARPAASRGLWGLAG